MKYNKKLIFSLFFLYLCSFSFAQDWPNFNRYKKANAELSSPQKGETRVLFMGNSITDYWIKHFPNYFSDNHYIDRGISGQTTPQMLVRFRADVINLEPAIVVILAGTNDIAGNTGPVTLEMIADNIFSMAELAKYNGIKVILCSVLPAYNYPWKPGLEPAPKIVELNKMIKEYATENDCIYLDYFSEMVDDCLGLKAEYSNDGVHPNINGYEVMIPLCDEAIKKALKK